MKSIKCKGGYIHKVAMDEIEYIGCIRGQNNNEHIKNAYARIKKTLGRAPDFLMNGELFDFGTRKAASDVVYGGEVDRLTESYGFAFPDNKKAVLSYKNNVGAADYIGGYPLIVREGKEIHSEPSGIGGSRGRTALGIDKDNLYIALIPDGNNDATLAELRKGFIKAGALDAINLDGGGSTQFYSPAGKHFTSRNVRGFVGVWLKKSVGDVRKVKVGTSLRVRSGPGYGYPRIDLLYNGDIVTVTAKSGIWCKIGEGRWVSSFYLKK